MAKRWSSGSSLSPEIPRRSCDLRRPEACEDGDVVLVNKKTWDDVWEVRKEETKRLGWIGEAGVDGAHRNQWEKAAVQRDREIESGQPGGDMSRVLGAEERRGCGVYMGVEDEFKSRKNRWRLLRGFRVHLGLPWRGRGEERATAVLASGGTRVAEREGAKLGRGGRGLLRACAIDRERRRWARPKSQSAHFFPEKSIFLFLFYSKLNIF